MVLEVVLFGEADAAEYLLAVLCCGQRSPARRGLGQQRGQVGTLVAGDVQRRLGALDRNQGLGQPVTYRLEAGDRLAELHPIERVLAGECQHGASGPEQPPAHRATGFGQPNRIALLLAAQR